MSSIVVIFVPWGEPSREVKGASRQPVEVVECIEIPDVSKAEPIEDADQMPLWRWFTF